MGDVEASQDAAPRKPKQPFLKRGEGVNKRLIAYKLREEAAVLRQQRSSTSSSNTREAAHPAASAGQFGHAVSTSTSSHTTTAHQRRTWQKQIHQLQEEQQQDLHAAVDSQLEDDTAAAAAAEEAGGSISAGVALTTSWAAGEDIEDMELEEFRALEREILGDGSHGASATQRLQPQPHGKRQQQQQQQQQQNWETADPAEGEAAEQGTQPQQPPQQQQQQPAPSGQTAVGYAGLSSSTNLLNICFQDDTEWVDTEFSFADLSLAAQQDQTHAGSQRLHQNKRQPRQHQQQEDEEQVHVAGAADADASEGPLAQQPYVRSIFRQQQQQQQSRPVSSQIRTAAVRRGARGVKSPPSSATADAAADTQAVDAADPEQPMVAVPVAAVARWQQMEAAQPGLQQEKVALRKMRQDLERAAQQLEQQRAAWERDRAAQQASFEAWKAEEARQLANRRRVLDQQYKAMYKMPTKKDKSALEAIEAALDREKSEAKAAAARHKLTVERLRCQVKQLQDRNNELHEEVRWHEAQQLNSTMFAVRDSTTRKRPTSSAQTQTEAILSQPARVSDRLLEQADCWTAAAEAAPAAADPLYAALFGDDDEEDTAAAAQSRMQPLRAKGRHDTAASPGSEGDMRRPAAGVAAGSRESQQSLDAGMNGSSKPSPSGRASSSWQQQPVGDVQDAQGTDDFSFTTLAQQGHSSSQPQQQQQQQQPPVKNGFHGSSSRASGSVRATAAAKGDAKLRSSGSPAAAAAVAGPSSAAQGSVASSSSQQQSSVRREVLREYVHPDGKVEQLFDDGSREVHFVNGTVQVHRPDSSTLVYFVNGDIKRQWPNARTDYYYAEVSVWQCTHSDGLDVFYYPTGQVEGHFADGRKEVIFADGAARIVTQDGVEHDVASGMLSCAVVEPPPDLNNL